MTLIQNKSALITGAGAGIGQLLAIHLASKGASRLHLWDLDPQGLQRTLDKVKQYSAAVFPLTIDVTDTAKVREEAERLAGEGMPVEILINNAGIIYGGLFVEQDPRQIELMLAVNLVAPLLLTRAFLPQMGAGGGHIVNVASAAGLVSNPGMAVYAASKWGMIGWSDSLRLELARTHPNVKVTTVTPYYISTGMFEGVKSNWLLPILHPEKVARAIVKGIERNWLFVRMPWLIHLTPLAKGILPTRWFDWFVGRLLGVYHSMDHFKGHSHPKAPQNND